MDFLREFPTIMGLLNVGILYFIIYKGAKKPLIEFVRQRSISTEQLFNQAQALIYQAQQENARLKATLDQMHQYVETLRIDQEEELALLISKYTKEFELLKTQIEQDTRTFIRGLKVDLREKWVAHWMDQGIINCEQRLKADLTPNAQIKFQIESLEQLERSA